MASDDCIVTMDGPAGSGKTTVAHKVADRLGFLFLDTGAMYRAATLAGLEAGVCLSPPDEKALLASIREAGLRLSDAGTAFLGDEEVGGRIREQDVTRSVSAVAAVEGVRRELTELQQDFGRRATPGLVAEGRDMGTVVFPDAYHRFFLDASVAVRAERRLAEMTLSGQEAPDRATVEESIRARDERDSTREIAPLRVGDGATVIDTTELEIDQVVERILDVVRGIGGVKA